MKRRYSKRYCLIIAMFILVSGICLEQPKTDSFFAYQDIVSSASYSSSSGRELSRYELSSIETLGVRDTAFISGSIRRPGARTVFRLSAILFLTLALRLGLSNLRAAMETAHAPETHYVTALLKYIQSQDGKK